MKRTQWIALALALLSLSGCSFVTSASPVSDTATGELWYVRQGHRRMRGIFYCPPHSFECVEAELRE